MKQRISDQILGPRAKVKWSDPWTEAKVRDRLDRYRSGNNDSRVPELIQKIIKRRLVPKPR